MAYFWEFTKESQAFQFGLKIVKFKNPILGEGVETPLRES